MKELDAAIVLTWISVLFGGSKCAAQQTAGNRQPNNVQITVEERFSGRVGNVEINPNYGSSMQSSANIPVAKMQPQYQAPSYPGYQTQPSYQQQMAQYLQDLRNYEYSLAQYQQAVAQYQQQTAPSRPPVPVQSYVQYQQPARLQTQYPQYSYYGAYQPQRTSPMQSSSSFTNLISNAFGLGGLTSSALGLLVG